MNEYTFYITAVNKSTNRISGSIVRVKGKNLQEAKEEALKLCKIGYPERTFKEHSAVWADG